MIPILRGTMPVILLLTTTLLAGCDAPPTAQAVAPAPVASSWPTSADAVRQRFLAEQLIEERDGDWSPVITEGDRRYRAIWYAPHDRDWDVRIWLDNVDRIGEISATGPAGDEFMIQNYAEEVLAAAAPALAEVERKKTAEAMSRLLRPGSKAELTVGPITLRGTSGYTHMTISASPAV